ncbi:MAG: two-component regulator propeller domain-containing protein, partial [Telluria sp.]
VSAIAPDGRGALWLATADGLKHFDPATGAFVTLRHDPAQPDSLSDDRVNALVSDEGGTLWVGTNSGLDRLERGATRFEHRATSASSARPVSVLSLSLAPDRTLWVGTSAGLEAHQPDRPGSPVRRFGASEGMSAGRIATLYHDREGRLWVGTGLDGLRSRAPNEARFQSYRHQPMDRHSLSNNQIGASYVDSSGTLWVGSWYGGVSRADLASGGFIRFTRNAVQSDSFGSNKVRALAGDGHGGLWLGTAGSGLEHLDPASGKTTRLRHEPGRPGSLPDNTVTALLLHAGRLWVGSAGGLSWRDPGTGRFTVVPLGAEPDTNHVTRLLADRAGALWVLTRAGLHQVDPRKGRVHSWRHHVREQDSLGDNLGLALIEDRQGALWIGTENGLDRFDRASGRFTHYRYQPGQLGSLRHSRIHHLYESKKGELWVGTAGGLHRLLNTADGKDLFRYYRLSNRRTAEPIGAILEDRTGSLWVSTTLGITRLDPDTGRFKSFTAKDGLIDGSYFIGSAFAAPDGTLHFGGVDGMTSFRPEAILENPYPPRVMITDFLVFNQSLRTGALDPGARLSGPIQDARSVTLSHRDSVFSLEFAALHYADPARNRYVYQLEGFDQDWVDTDAGKRFATYTNLDPGRYVFRVRASNKDGVWSKADTALTITITPPFWKTWWFRLLAASLVLGSAYGALRVRLRSLMQQKTLLERQVGARTAELVQEKEAVVRQKETVELAHRNISLLSEIGRELTAKLDSESIMLKLYDHVNVLMDATVFGIGMYRPEREIIEIQFAIEGGKRFLPYSRSMREPNQLAVWCVANQKDVFINNLGAEYRNYIEDLSFTSGSLRMGGFADGSLCAETRSLLYVPISVNGRTLGVVSVHSYRENAYQRIHLDMLRTLASYVGVAFDNADAYRQLKDTQVQLVAQEKLAALGSLVAGVSHELNTPIGNSLLMASTLQEKTDDMARKLEAMTMRRSELAEFIAASQEASSLIMRSLVSAADLVNSFKQVAVDQASAQRRKFNLEQAVHEIVATMMNQVRKSGHTLVTEIAHDIEMDSFPGPLGQVVINFINNAVLHAFEERAGGRMTLSASVPEPGRVLILFSDDGAGIPVEHLARIFDPFFTTRMGRGGSGLGLNITYNIVTSLLGGQIRVESSVGQGTTFILDLPLSLPAATT